MHSESLRDIKPWLEIPDNSEIILMGLVVFGILLVLAILFFVVRKILEYRKENLAKKYLAKLYAIDWKNAKQSAYAATHYARLLATDTRRKELFAQLEPLLEQYKYRKKVAEVDEETLRRFTLYLQIADESV